MITTMIYFLLFHCIPSLVNSSATVLCIGDAPYVIDCSEGFLSFFKNNNTGQNSTYLNGIVVEGTTDFLNDINNILNMDNKCPLDFLIAIGNEILSAAATTVSEGLGIPLLLYNTSPFKRMIYENNVIPLHPDHYSMGYAIAELTGPHTISKTCIYMEDTYVAEGFVEGFRALAESIGFQDSQEMLVSSFDKEDELTAKLLRINEGGYRLIILHTSEKLMIRIMEIAWSLNYFQAGYAWLLTETSFTESTKNNTVIPVGMLTIVGYQRGSLNTRIQSALITLEYVVTSMLADENASNNCFHSENWRNMTESIVQTITSPDEENRIPGLQFVDRFRLSNNSFLLQNLVSVHNSNNTIWKEAGIIHGEDWDFSSITWPGNTIFGPFGKTKPLYRVVTRPAEPFVMIHGPVEHSQLCYADISCLQVFTYDSYVIKRITEDFLGWRQDQSLNYRIFCCKGITIDLLNEISRELDFEYVAYFQNDTDYGTFKNDSVSGLVSNIVSGAADIIAGAFSVTRERMIHITYTEPFYYTGFSMIARGKDFQTSPTAFLKPFSTEVWLCIFLSGMITAIATSLLEWNSPYGLNPWGRKRQKNYTLGSGMVMVYSVLFGHTVSTKSPKSWPSKVLQNFWSGLAIFIIASYTANLAAYLAGRTTTVEIRNVSDAELMSKKIGVITSSAVERFLSKMNPDLKMKLHSVENEEDALWKIRNGLLDYYVDDMSVLEYTLHQLDNNCSLAFAARHFGDDFYSFGLGHTPWLREQMTTIILKLLESGYMDELERKFFSVRECDYLVSKDSIKYGLEHTGGLFILLVCAIGAVIILFTLEHVLYRYLVPTLREKPATSVWKNRNLEFFSHRLYRTVISQKLISPQETAQRMVQMMKDRQFAKIFQKNQLTCKGRTSINRSKRKNFLDLTSDILSFQRMAKQSTNSSYEGNAMSVFTRTSASNEGNSTSVFMTTSIEEENLDNLNSFMSSDTDDAFTSRENNDGFNGRCYANFAYASDENKTEMCDTNAKKELTLSPNQSNVHPFVNTPQQSLNWSTVGRLNSDRNRLLSPIKKISLANIPRFRRQHAINDTRVSRKQFRVNIKNDDHYHCRRKSTWPRQQKQPERSRKISDSFCICSSGASSAEFPNMCSQSKQDGNSLVLKNNLNSGSSNHSSSITLKNNKVKSCIRNEAMSDISLRTSSSSHNCAVSALSKEDLLVLWKRSEIELQTRLNSVLLQNDHLKRLLRSMYGTSHIVIEEDGSIVKNKETEL